MSLRPFPLPNESSQSPHLDQDLAQNQNQDQDQPLSSAPHTEQPTLPPIRACLFDLDGLLINTEDMLEASINTLLKKHGRPCLTREVRTALLGVPDSSNSEWFLAWVSTQST
jgi:pseudouridine-5'-monophosphatase